MKILFIDTYYPAFIKNVRLKNKNLAKKTYSDQLKFLLSQCFGTSDFFSFNFKKLGWEANDLIVNDEILQKRWAMENQLEVEDNRLVAKIQMIPYAYRFVGKPNWVQEIAMEQIKKYKPDIAYIQDLSILNIQTLKKVKKYCKLLVGQIASPLPPKEYLKCFDLIITSFPHYVELIRKMGIKSEYHKLAFEQRVLKKVGDQKRIYDVAFVGSFTPYHQKGTNVLMEAARESPIHVWGQGIRFLSPFSPLRKNYHGEAWGLEMYKILAQSKIVINRHIAVADGYANNMRLYEATGMGAMLITDSKKNLNDLFKVGEEVVGYKDAKDLLKKINYYLKNSDERERIAGSGQKRTLNDHDYKKRMKELDLILKKYLHER